MAVDLVEMVRRARMLGQQERATRLFEELRGPAKPPSELPPGAAPVVHSMFPYVPAGWFELAPYVLMTGANAGPTSGRRRASIHKGMGYYVVTTGFWGETNALDSDGNLHVAIPGYKLADPPRFGSFEDVVRVADAYADGKSPSVVHRDRVTYEVHDDGEAAGMDVGHRRYSVRTLWNEEMESATGPTYDTYLGADRAATRKNAAAKAARTCRARS